MSQPLRSSATAVAGSVMHSTASQFFYSHHIRNVMLSGFFKVFQHMQVLVNIKILSCLCQLFSPT